MTTLRHSDAVAVSRSCPACAADVIVRGVLQFKRVYLCDPHRATFDSEDAKDRAKEQRRIGVSA